MLYIYGMKTCLLFLIFVASFFTSVYADSIVRDFDYDASRPETMGFELLPAVETVTVFQPDSTGCRYNNGLVLYPFKGKLFAQWQSSDWDEDASDTRVLYSVSSDGLTWSEPMPLPLPPIEGIWTNGGWWADASQLIAFVNAWSIPTGVGKKGTTYFLCSEDGIHWTEPLPVCDVDGRPVPGVMEQDLRRMPNGELLTTFHVQPGLIAVPHFTSDSTGKSGWIRSQMASIPMVTQQMSRGIEPSWFVRSDGSLVMVFRDQRGSHRLLYSISSDSARHWTTPVESDFLDSRAKQSAGNLPNGITFLVHNPSGSKTRFPLSITWSRDGIRFDRMMNLRIGGADLPDRRFEGRYKSIGYHYPKSVIWNDYLYVGYATNKEMIQCTRIPLAFFD